MNLTAWRYKQFHVSYLLAWLAVGLLGGLVLGRRVTLGDDALILCIGFILMLGALRSRRWWSIVAIILAGICLGLLRGSSVHNDFGRYELLVSQQVIIRGVMSGDAQQTTDGRQKITLSSIHINKTVYRGEVFATTYSNSVLKRGDTVTVLGTLREGFASYGATLSSGKIISIERGTDFIRDVRERFSGAVRSVVSEPMASLGLGFVVGQRSTLPDTLDEQLKVVGLTHIVVASGYNLTILVRFVMRILAKYSRYLAFVGSLSMIIMFVLFSGFSPSMNRAVIVTILSLLAWYVGRRFHPVLLILYVAAATAVVNPMYIWADLGWYLSFFAFGGILVVAPLVMKYLYRRREPSPFEQLVAETMSAEIMALPLIAFAFGTFPVFGLIANVLVAPFIPAAMALTAAAGTVAMISSTFAMVLALPTTILIGYMIAIVEWLSDIPVAEQPFTIGLGMLCLWYAAVGAICMVLRSRTKYDFRRRDLQLEV